jgi:hypothetical protein
METHRHNQREIAKKLQSAWLRCAARRSAALTTAQGLELHAFRKKLLLRFRRRCLRACGLGPAGLPRAFAIRVRLLLALGPGSNVVQWVLVVPSLIESNNYIKEEWRFPMVRALPQATYSCSPCCQPYCRLCHPRHNTDTVLGHRFRHRL